VTISTTASTTIYNYWWIPVVRDPFGHLTLTYKLCYLPMILLETLTTRLLPLPPPPYYTTTANT
jgi:hypothetical protein